MFEQFTSVDIPVSETTIHTVYGGSGAPLLLLHGYPETHACWRLVAPLLAKQFTVVCADLRGCGDSGKPPGDARHLTYSKRTMARDQVEVMAHLGFHDFFVAGHDRGARVAHRMALDHPNHITKLALLDIVPTRWAFQHIDKDLATAAFNWFFSAQKGGLPERLIAAEADFYLQWLLDDFAGKKNTLAPEAVREYQRCFRDSIAPTCEEFRAAASIDLQHDAQDEDQKIACPTFLLWSGTGMWAKYNMIDIWKERALHVTGQSMNTGHFLQEEDPEGTAHALLRFFK